MNMLDSLPSGNSCSSPGDTIHVEATSTVLRVYKLMSEDTSNMKKEMRLRKIREGFTEDVTFAMALKSREIVRGRPSSSAYWIDQILARSCTQGRGEYRPWSQSWLRRLPAACP